MCRSKCKSNKYRNLGTLRTFLCLMLSDRMCISIHISYLSCQGLLWLISSTQTHHFVIFLSISCLLEQSLKQDLRASQGFCGTAQSGSTVQYRVPASGRCSRMSPRLPVWHVEHQSIFVYFKDAKSIKMVIFVFFTGHPSQASCPPALNL